VCAGISSASYRQLLLRTATSDPVLAEAGAAALAAGVEGLLLDRDTAINPHLGFASTDANGFATVTVGNAALEVSFWITSGANARRDLTADPKALADGFRREQLRVLSGQRELQRLINGAWHRWDVATLAWQAV
jgi:hypothetical protein